ncbi:MAG: ATP-binding protein, partial [Candidatus Omnitrophota bacterium]|nr:ATP-binding protein [Candidatus Omnitrophota bacterium]
ADNIIRVLLDLSRATKLEKKPEDINSLLENSLLLIQHVPMLANIKIVRELGKDLPKVSVDRGKMEQVFINLLLNSVQAMPEGGSLFLRTYQARLNELKGGIGAFGENYFNPGEAVLAIEIEDTGMGISQEDLKKIFDPFFSTKEPGQGTGLGLSISKNILSLHKGLIQMESKKNIGTKVTVTLKITDGGAHE